MGFEENEISIKAAGGTELAKRELAAEFPADFLDNFQIICSRVREINPEKIRIYWCHDLPNDPECAKLADEEFRNQFHLIVFVSNWQYQQFINVLGIPYSQKHIVIEHGVRTFDDDQLNNRPNPQEQLRLIYTSTPHRGLGILVPVFQKLAENNPNIHLDVFSSFAIYGWPETDQQFEQLLNICREHPQITYHGSAPNDVVREHLARAHVFAYPSIWPETSCRSLIEAMMAGLVCVHPNYAALPDTASGFTYMYSGDQNHEIHAQLFYDGLSMLADEAANGNFVNQKQLAMMRWYANYRFNMVQAKTKWATVMHMLLQNFPTVESRKIPEKTFTFKIG